MEDSILPKVTDDLPTFPAFRDTRWKHLSNLELADPDYEFLVGVEILLGGKVLVSPPWRPFQSLRITVSVQDVFRLGNNWQGEWRELTALDSHLWFCPPQL